MSQAVEILLIDNAERDLAEVPGLLAKAGYVAQPQAIGSAAALNTALESRAWNVAVCAYSVSGFTGLPVLTLLKTQARHLPVVVVSRVTGAEAAVAAMKAGATDYLMQTELARLVPALREAQNRRASDGRGLAAETALRESEAGLRRAQLLARLAHIITRPDGSFERYSESLLELLGVDAAGVPDSTRAWLDILHVEDREAFRSAAIRAGVSGQRIEVEYRLRHADGAWRHMRQVIEPLSGTVDVGGKMRWFCTLQDVTHQKVAEEKIRDLNLDLERDMRRRIAAEQEHAALEAGLREAQKMEALGTLAGGIAHDFNNLLAAMLGNVSLARMNLAVPQKLLYNLDQIDKAGARAKELVKQILSFSRKQPQQFVVQSMRTVVIEALSLLRSTLPAGVDLVINIADAQPMFVSVDGGQISQVLMNLCTNAWHATSGLAPRIEVLLDEVTLNGNPAQHPGGLAAGVYVRLQVRDNGHGMDAQTQAHIFEPFFTTKPAGQGTGLGLAVVHGIVKTHGGAIAVKSMLSGGTTFTVYLPAVAAPDTPEAEAPVPAPADGLGRKVMYVDDYDAMGELISEALGAAGYCVTVHTRGETALADLRAHPGAYGLVITDQNMPSMAGTELARQIRLIEPDLPVIISSGYISEELRARAREVGVPEVVDKTRSIERLVASIPAWMDTGKR